jgi:predicted nucleotidyltransferase component of viral defense system
MIRQKEISDIAALKGVPKTTIDKDWALGHFLNAFYDFSHNQRNFIFKGGTCLHKCYLEGYRFSEDLDFTLIDKDFVVDRSFINQVIRKAEAASSIKFHLNSIENQAHNNIQQGYLVEIKFWGADHHPNQPPLPPSRWQSSIHLDISFTEKLLLHAIEKSIMHPYSDYKIIQSKAICYDFKELLSEKIRALKQRNRPRDVYDVWYLGKMVEPEDYAEIKHLLFEKSLHKGHEIKGPEDFVNEKKAEINKIAWDRSLSHQLSSTDLGSFNVIYKELGRFIAELLSAGR